ncbi:MAG: hypothetical protein PHP43_00575 [Methanoculleus sp.]|nr:hypothetical protein [Methanoculleus sp.]
MRSSSQRRLSGFVRLQRRWRQAFSSPCSSPTLSTEITLEDYRTRSIGFRVKESISRLFSPLG